MIEKRAALRIIVGFLTLLAFSHTILQLAIFRGSISGFSIEGNELADDLRRISPVSMMIIIVEWGLLVTIVSLSSKKNKKELEKDLEIINLKKKYENDKNMTDLDTLYALLKEKKHLRLRTISKAFNVNKEVAQNWCESLEEGDLAILHYPRIGDPEIILK